MSDKPTNFICWVCILLSGSGIAGFLAFTKGHSDAESSKAPLRRVRRTRRKDSHPLTRESYCGRACLSEGQLKYVRIVLRAKAEMIEHG